MRYLACFFVFLFCAVTISAQENNTDILKETKIDFCGVDFSMAKVVGADEGIDKFPSVFLGINQLFVDEAKKYNLEYFLNKTSVNIDLSAVRKSNEAIDCSLLFKDSGIELTKQQIEQKIQSYNLEAKNSLGFVIIVQNLNKAKLQGEYYFVFFDTKTRKIASSMLLSAAPKGFGLRNYWAGSIYSALNKYRKIKP